MSDNRIAKMMMSGILNLWQDTFKHNAYTEIAQATEKKEKCYGRGIHGHFCIN